jgi:hypothetical protein
MPRTLRLPDPLDGTEIVEYLKEEAKPVRAGEPILAMKRRQNGVLHGEPQTLAADVDGVLLRLLMCTGKTCRAGMPMALVGEAGEDVGIAPARVHPVRMLVLRKCSECGSEYPVNGFVERVRCVRCGDVQIASPSFWSEHVGPPAGEACRPRNLHERWHQDDYGESKVQAWGIPPLCRQCQGLLEWNAVVEAAEKARQGQAGSVFCGECGEAHGVRLPPAWATGAFGSLSLLIGETASDAHGSPPPQPVVFKCPSCLAPLKIDGAKRIVHCGHCDCDVYLPDDLWLHFNPAMKRARWWMVFR